MILGDRQEQTVSEGASAYQAGRDLTIVNGLSVTDVRELCGMVLRENFPRLREEARLAAEQHVADFAATLEQTLINRAATVDLNKFSDPDTQAALNDAVQGSARKGAAASPEVLSALLAERVAQDSTEFKDFVLTEAVKVVPRLTYAQISLVTLVLYASSFFFVSLPDIHALELLSKLILPILKDGFAISDTQKLHIAYAGACSINPLFSGDIYQSIATTNYGYLGYSTGAEFKAAATKGAPSYAAVLDEFEQSKLYRVQLTSVGIAIALANLSRIIQGIDYKIWLR